MTGSTPSEPEEKAGTADTPESAANPPQSAAFAVVGIGASAGGLEAASQLLAHLPDDTGMAFVFIQHLDPKHESNLERILAKATPIPVQEATHGLAVQPNHVYLIPRNTTMTIAGGLLQLKPRGEGRGPHLPVDAFFKSLAADRQTAAIGVILSGTGSDGTLGVEDIKAAGGITFAQDEESAKYAGMPQSAVRSGCIDVVLPPEAIARELARVGQHPYVTAATVAADAMLPVTEEASFRNILKLLRASFGVDFSGYRDTTIRRRIMRRMVLHIKEDLADYARHLEKDGSELEALYQDILINVTSFFREPETFEALKKRVFPEILKNKPADAPIRIWVPGCSTGQEAYSLAMALLEFLDDASVKPAINVFATDLSDTFSLQKARDGIYPENIEAEVTPERLQRFFTRQDSKYRVNKAIREMCLFAKQNVAADPPFSRVDLISCRNLLIYLAPPLQKRVIPTFHYALNPNGFLLLGASETIGSFSDLFAPVDREHRIYCKKTSATRAYPHFAADAARVGQLPRNKEPGAAPVDWQREADRAVLGRYAPPGVLVNDNLDVLQFRGETDAYLKPAVGEASFNVLKMAREGLLFELRSAIAECRMRNAEARRADIRIRGDARGVRKIDLRVVPVKAPGNNEQCFLILFEDATLASSKLRLEPGESRSTAAPSRRGRVLGWFRRRPAAGSAGDSSSPEEQDSKALRQELASTREYLQSVIEEQDASNEELKSANEEILSSNEELQSTNEELETAKEELQSVNEELTTINEQLQNRNTELSRLNDDVSNLLASANVPMVAVSGDLRIRRFTPSAAKLLNVLPADIGRPIGNLRPAIDIPDLEALIAEVVDTVQVREREVRDREGRHHLLRIHPFRTADNRIDGAVVVLLDIEELTLQAARLRQKAALIDLSSDAIIVRNRDSVITFWNHGAQDTYGWTATEAIGKVSHALLQTSSPGAGGDIDALLRSRDRWQGEVTHTRRDGTRILVESSHVVHRAENGDLLGILEINRDITDRQRMIDELARNAAELAAADRRKNEFLATLAHELRNPLTPLRNGIHILDMIGSRESEAIEARGAIKRSIDHMTRLIDDLLDISRITRGHIELRRETADIGATVKDAVAEFQAMADTANRKLTVRLPREPLYVDADALRLTQVVENLLHNAIKFTDDGAEIEVALSQEDGQAVLKVRDSGIGIAPENLSRIWDPFTQADTSLERERGGLGIGLTLVRTLVELHGGSVAVHSGGVGKGSEFVVRLPSVARRRVGAKTDRAPQSKTQPAALSGHRILIVDDNTDAANSLASLLSLMDNDVRTANDGPEALRVAAEYGPEIILLDIGLPGMNGYDVVRALRRDSANGRPLIVAVSGYGSREDMARSVEAGFDAHFVKPMEISALQEFLTAQAR
ncbi:MAG TPA: chemotaxis protein CheB [Casimicrobiaceae bacterium]